jgi:hypothetical protein
MFSQFRALIIAIMLLYLIFLSCIFMQVAMANSEPYTQPPSTR